MRKSLLAVFAALALVTGIAGAVSAGVQHIVTEGGSDIDNVRPGEDTNASLVAIMMDDGTVMGQWHDNLWGNLSGRPMIIFHARVVCLDVYDNEAYVIGEITNPPDSRGSYMWQGLRDLGVSANDQPDQITFLHSFDTDGDPCSFDPPDRWFRWVDYSRGQVTVE
jgi:hypothetical protein